MPVEEFREKEAPDAAYMDGTPDGSRPGHVMVNTGDFAKRTLLDLETTAYHEGVPGHHMQISIAQELPRTPTLPPARSIYGLHRRLGALLGEVWAKKSASTRIPTATTATCRMTCCGRFAWSLTPASTTNIGRGNRSSIISTRTPPSTKSRVQSETDRYMAWPAQALGYKIGQLEILKLRQYAKDQLGDKFDIRALPR